MKHLIAILISLSDTSMTIDSHNWHFVFDYLFVLSRNIEQAHNNQDSFNIVLSAVDAMI